MEENKVTAEWARKTSNNVLGDKVSKEIKECDKIIKDAVKKNEMTCNIFFNLQELTKKDLIGRGFKLDYYEGHDQRDSSYITINW